jgi:hypothetical protein
MKRYPEAPLRIAGETGDEGHSLLVRYLSAQLLVEVYRLK